MASLASLRSGRSARAAAVAAAVAAFVVASPNARGALPQPGAVSGASPKLAQRLQQLGTPELRTAPGGVQARRLDLPASGPGSLVRLGQKLVVTARVSATGTSVQQQLQQAGAQIISLSDRYRTITLGAAPADLDRLAALPAVQSVEPELQPLVAADALTSTLACPWGGVRSEGDTQLQAASARSAFGVDGSGVKVGIISDSFDTASSAITHWAGDVTSGELPGPANPCGYTTPVQDLLDSSGGADEGRAMAQVVHDLAPGAALSFASAFTSASYPQLVANLRANGAKVIADDVTWFDEPFFQDGPEAVAANSAAAAGVPVFSSAANSNVIVNGNNVGSWEAPAFRPTACPGTLSAWTSCMDFDPGSGVSNTEKITLADGGGFMLDVQWGEPWYGVSTNLDAVLLDASGNVLAQSDDVNTGSWGTQKPFEFFQYDNTTGSTQDVYLAIAKRGTGGGDPRVKYVLMDAYGIQSVQFPTSSDGDIVGPTIFGHNGAAGAMSMAAVPYNNSSRVESFSSRGPVTHYFGPVSGTTPAGPLSEPQVLAKPDAAATDGAATTFFASLIGSTWRFYGTSESSPHAAAIAALQLNADPTATVPEIYGALKSTAVPVGSYGADAAGSGLLNAFGAVNALLKATPTVSTGSAGLTGATAATLTGTVTPNGYATAYRFDYGPTAAYGSSTATVDAGAGTSPVTASAQLTALAPATTYHYRLVALRGGAVAVTGADQTFATPDTRPPATSSTPSATGRATPYASLSCSPGAWTRASWLAYGWLRDGSAMGGENAATLRLGNDDVGHRIACRVIAGNGYGTAASTSTAITIADVTPPRLRGLLISPSRFRAAGTGPSILSSGGSKLPRVSFAIDERAAVSFTIERSLPGRREGGRCRSVTRANRRAARCTRYATLRTSFWWIARSGTNRFRLTGRINNRRLPAGSYRLVARARDMYGNLAAPKRAGFTIT